MSSAALERLLDPARIVVFDGAMGTMLYSRGVFINQCYDELNLRAPDLVKEIHRAYTKAGAEIIETNSFGANRAKLAPKVASGVVYVDGLGVGDVSQSVMRDRWSIGTDGIFLVVISIDRQTGQVVAGPDIVTKGFVPEEDAADIVDRTRQKILDGLAEAQSGEHLAEAATLRESIHDTVTSYLYERTKRRPMVLPVIMQV